MQGHFSCSVRHCPVIPSLTVRRSVEYRRSTERPPKADEQRRTFTDEEGVYWDVREVKNSDYDRRGGKSLVFESIHSFRRVRNYPDDWFGFSETDLADLSHRT